MLSLLNKIKNKKLTNMFTNVGGFLRSVRRLIATDMPINYS